MNLEQQNELVEKAQHRAFLYSLLTIPFVALPDGGFAERIRSRDFMEILESLAADRTLQDDITGGAAMMLSYLTATADLTEPDLALQLGLDRTFLYRGIMAGTGSPPPYEAVWSAETDVNAVLLKLAEVYRQSAMAMTEEAHERLDYIGIELDYLRRLAQQEEMARQENSGQVQNLVDRQAGFFREHVGQWAPLFIDRALPQAKTDFYRGHLRILRGFLADERKTLLGEDPPAQTPPAGG